MNAGALVETSNFADELYDFLISIDSAVWRDDMADAAAQTLETLRKQADELQAEWSALSDDASSKVYSSFCELHSMLDLQDVLADAAGEWEVLRTKLTPLYEGMAAALKSEGEVVRHVHPTNFWRNGIHVSSGVCLMLACEHVFTWWSMLLFAAGWVVWAWTLEITRRRYERWNDFLMGIFGRFSRPHERYRVNSATWYGTALLGVAITAPNYCGILGVLTLAIGDPAASICGRKFGKTKVFNGKSLEGSVAFALCASVAGFGYLFAYHSYLPVSAQLALAFTAGVIGAVVELISTRIEDNVTIPLAVAWCGLALSWLLGISPLSI